MKRALLIAGGTVGGPRCGVSDYSASVGNY
jgi:hypothetical protein